MARSVTVRGSLMPAAGVLPRGEEATYADGPNLRDLISKGFLVLVSEELDDVPAPVDGHPELEAEHIAGDGEEPSRNGTTEEWREFFALKVPDETIPEDAGRTAIIAAWDRYLQQLEGGS